MDVSIHSGHTKSGSDLSLVALELESNQGEQVVALLQVHADSVQAKTLEKELAAVIKHSLLETDGEAGARLDGTLKEINGLLKGLILSHSVDDVHAIIAILGTDGTLSVSHAGRAEAYIIRSGTASQITEYSRGKPTPAFVHIASGPVEPRDVVVFSTQRLLRAVTPAQMAQLAQRDDQLVDELKMALEAEKEKAAICTLHVSGGRKAATKREMPVGPSRRGGRRSRSRGGFDASALLSRVTGLLSGVFGVVSSRVSDSGITQKVVELPSQVLADLKDPARRKKAHLIILAAAIALFLVVWASTNLATSSQRGATKAELEELVEQIDQEIQTAENQRLTGDIDSANAILERAEERAKQVMDNESGYFRMEALDMLDRIRLKKEEINNITRLSPRVVVNLSAKTPDVVAQGLVGITEGEFIVYDKQDLYRVLLNSVDSPDRLTDEELISLGTYFERMQTLLFQTDSSSIIEIINGQATSMKTEDSAGWIAGKAILTYLRFLYLLSPENNQIYKYERLSNRYSAPSQYNVNGDLSGAIDMTIDGNVYVLKEGGDIVKLFRGESRPFVIRHLPEGALETTTKIYKVFDGNLYFLDPVNSRVIVVTDGGATGESSYVQQYILEGEQIGTLTDLYVDPEELRLNVLDEKRLYAIDLVAN